MLIVNDRDKKYSSKRSVNNVFKIWWNCKNKINCNGTLMSTRDVVDLCGVTTSEADGGGS